VRSVQYDTKSDMHPVLTGRRIVSKAGISTQRSSRRVLFQRTCTCTKSNVPENTVPVIVVFVVYPTSFNQLHLQRTLYIQNRFTIPGIWYRVHKTQLNRLQCTLFLEGVAPVQNPKSPFNPTRDIQHWLYFESNTVVFGDLPVLHDYDVL
jgi:hypothetical protein